MEMVLGDLQRCPSQREERTRRGQGSPVLKERGAVIRESLPGFSPPPSCFTGRLVEMRQFESKIGGNFQLKGEAGDK